MAEKKATTKKAAETKEVKEVAAKKTTATKKAVVWLTDDSKDIEIFAGL